MWVNLVLVRYRYSYSNMIKGLCRVIPSLNSKSLYMYMYKNCLNFILQVLVFNTLALSITLSNTVCLICENFSQKGSCINFTTLGI